MCISYLFENPAKNISLNSQACKTLADRPKRQSFTAQDKNWSQYQVYNG